MEPRWDFDLADLTTLASREGGKWVINGAKCAVPLAAESDQLLVYAKTGSSNGFSDIDAFLVPRNAPGLKLGEREKNMGLRGLATYELTLENCKVGADAR